MMRLWFECPVIKMGDVYSGKKDLHRHLARQNQVWGIEPRPEWVHMFIHTLGKVPTECYLEIELCRGTSEWSTLTERFIETFIFESGFDTKKPTIECATLVWNAQMKDIVNCRNMIVVKPR